MLSLLINKDGAQFLEIENTNDAIERALGWNDAWNMPTIQIMGHDYIVICSDLGKMRHEQVSAMSYTNIIDPKEALREPFLVGPILISKFNGKDGLKSLNKNDIERLKSRLYKQRYETLEEFYKTILIID